MADKKQTQVCDIRSSTGMSRGLSNEQLRVASDGAYPRRLSANFDPTREKLNFEIGRGGVLAEVNKKKSIQRRIKDNLKARDIKDPNDGVDRHNIRTVANIILQGSTETMRKLAFGDQEVNWDHGSDNSHITRCPEIEQWAQDMYKFMSRKYGEENIAAFIVHLDESNPHIHCTLLPITSNNKFSWKQVFVGKDKFEYSARMKALHDELAEVNKKWGLERGDPIALTGAQHKSYNQYLQEQIQQKEQVSDELDTTISDQRSESRHLNKNIKKAQKRLKGLSTMYENLLQKKEALEQQMKVLEQQLEKGAIDLKTYQNKKDILQKECDEVLKKISTREEQIAEAERTLDQYLLKQINTEEEVEKLERRMQSNLPSAVQRIIQEQSAKMLSQASADFREKFNDFLHFRNNLSYAQQQQFDELFQDNPVMENLIADTSKEVMEVAAHLFLGQVEAAGQIALSHGGGGGGGGSSSGWGRSKDDDDDLWWRKCMARAKHMMKKPSGQGLKR